MPVSLGRPILRLDSRAVAFTAFVLLSSPEQAAPNRIAAIQSSLNQLEFKRQNKRHES